MQRPNGQPLWATWWFLVSKLILKWKSRNIWYLPLEEWMMWDRGTLVPVHSWGGLCPGVTASFIQLLNLGFHSPYLDFTFGFLCPVLERKGRAISHHSCEPWETQVQNLLYMEPKQQCLWPCSGHSVCVPEASLGFGSAGHDSHLWDCSAPSSVRWGWGMAGEEGRSVVLGQGTW